MMIDPLILKAAVAAHEINREYCRAIGDDSQVPWEGAPKWQQDSAIKGAEFIRDNPDAKASASHDSWLTEKKSDGWKFGKVKDEEQKTHPCYVPYEKLPVEQQSKDHLFGAVVRGVLAAG